ncbi:MAG: type II toxin-antitoxin system YafQ family toxin [Lactobacillales bacterium]|jgi:mRNA interferase YafQ|nr:type II toxin-antitoxin system YafQ family toxin [Lactobacillales bacterium]
MIEKVSYAIRTTSVFDKRLKNLQSYFNLTNQEAKEAIKTIKETMILLKKDGFLPKEYDNHDLTKEPWRGFREYHVLDDVLVVYYKVEKKRRIRFTTITTHDELRKGNIS